MKIIWTLLALLVAMALGGCAAESPSGEPSEGARADEASEASSGDSTARFAGTWKLVDIERRDADGEIVPPTAEPSIGFLMYDPAGYMGVVIQRADRQPSAGERRTPEEALAALGSYTSYFGTFTVDDAASTVTHHLQGSLSPSGAGSDYVRSFELSDNQLTLEPPTGPSGAVVRLSWERVPDVEQLSDEHRRFIGFWKFVVIERRGENGDPLPANQYENGFIIYTASGHMAVHLMRPGRQRYADRRPTPEEADAAMGTYASYFGPFTIHQDDGYVVHHRIGHSSPDGIGSDAQRFYELTEDRLILKPPARTIDGVEVQSALTWERLSR